jgi:hypothetical protein
MPYVKGNCELPNSITYKATLDFGQEPGTTDLLNAIWRCPECKQLWKVRVCKKKTYIGNGIYRQFIWKAYKPAYPWTRLHYLGQ